MKGKENKQKWTEGEAKQQSLPNNLSPTKLMGIFGVNIVCLKYTAWTKMDEPLLSYLTKSPDTSSPGKVYLKDWQLEAVCGVHST